MQRHNPLFLIGFLNLVLAGCASQSLRLPEAETEPPAATAPVVHATDTASSVALQALAYLGTPYRSGGLSPQSGFDCSGLVVYAYRQGAGLALPRDTFDLSHIGRVGRARRAQTRRPGVLQHATASVFARRHLSGRGSLHPRPLERRRSARRQPARQLLDAALQRRAPHYRAAAGLRLPVPAATAHAGAPLARGRLPVTGPHRPA